MSSISVCKDCPDRKIGCHATCQKYIEQSEQNRKEKLCIWEARKIDEAQRDRAIEGHIRMQKRRKH